MRFWCVLLGLLCAAPALAEPVSVNKGNGLGFVFNHRGNCYLILPQHVHGMRTRLSVATAAPSTIGDAEVFRRFDPDLDLSVAFLTDGLGQRCQDRWEDLPRDVQPSLDRSDAAMLVRVDASGNETHDSMRIVASTLETILAVVDEAGRAEEIYQGTSGGILKIGDTVVGMAIQSANADEALFLRMDEIVARLGRQLDARVNRVAESAPPPVAAGTCPAGSVALRAVSCDVEPDAPEHACSNLAAGTGPAVFAAGDARPTLTLAFELEEAVPLTAVSLVTQTGAGVYSPPQSLLLEASSTSKGAPRWRRYASGDMSPLGSFKVSNAAGPFARQLRITVLSQWDDSLPLRLDCVAIN